ncbi:MAG: hotdog family protein [Acidimicrobiales bacterium]
MNQDRPRRLLLAQVSPGVELPELSYPVTATTVVLGAMASRDWRPMHHDKDFARDRNGTSDIFLNTPSLAAWFERFVTDWSGPYGRIRRVAFHMLGSIFPGDTMVFRGVVTALGTDGTDCGWADVDVTVSVDGEAKTTCRASVALPVDESDNPWTRRGDRWQPQGP